MKQKYSSRLPTSLSKVSSLYTKKTTAQGCDLILNRVGFAYFYSLTVSTKDSFAVPPLPSVTITVTCPVHIAFVMGSMDKVHVGAAPVVVKELFCTNHVLLIVTETLSLQLTILSVSVMVKF